MSRKKRSNGEKIGGQFAGLPHNLIKSRAFFELKGTAVKLLMLLMTRYNGRNNGRIAFGYSDAEKLGVARNSTQRAFIELQDKGFIKQTKAGVYRGNVSEWLLTFRSDDRNGHARTDDWKQYPNNEKDAELIAAKRDKYARAKKASKCERIETHKTECDCIQENANDNRSEHASAEKIPFINTLKT